MSIGSISSTSAAASGTSSGTSSQQLTQADFLQLMTAQLQAQDPTQPMDNSQFASQLAQFSQLSATQNLDTTVQTLSGAITSSMQQSQVLSSASLVGRQVLAPSTTIGYSGAAVSGAVNVTTAGDVQVNIDDSSGNVVRTIDLGSQPVGLAHFSWDGKDSSGNVVSSTSSYSLSANLGGSKTNTMNTYLSGDVTGVGYGGTSVGTYLQVAGIGGVPLSAIAQIN